MPSCDGLNGTAEGLGSRGGQAVGRQAGSRLPEGFGGPRAQLGLGEHRGASEGFKYASGVLYFVF